MTIRLLDAERLLDQLQKTETIIKRLEQNQAYQSQQEIIRDLKRLIGDHIPSVESNLADRKDNELIDPTGLLYPGERRRLNLEVSRLQRAFENDIQEPLNQILEEVQGPAAKMRWGVSLAPKPHPAPPVIEVRDRWAMSVGIGDYQQAGLSSLSTPALDASTIHNLLLNDRRFGRQPEKTGLFIDSQARRDQILDTVGRFAQAADSKDMLFFYFSGHGDVAAGEAVLIPYDYNRDAPHDSALSIAEITHLMQSSPAKTKIIILDACHSGPDIPVGEEEKQAVEQEKRMSADFINRVFEQARGTAVLSSCVKGQVSWTYKAKGLSVFTYFLGDGLRGQADFDGKGFVTVSDVFHYVANEVKQWGDDRTPKLTQTPGLSYTTTGEIILMDYRSGEI